MMAKGSLAFVDSYSKSTSITGFDKPRMHCVPWCLARIFIAYHVLASPLAAMLVEREEGHEARYIQETRAFSLRGSEVTSEQFSSTLSTYFQRYVGCKDMGLSTYRQFASTVEEKLTPWLKNTSSRMITMGDAQAGHSTTTARIHYGVEAGHTAQMTAGDYIAYRGTSLCWANLTLRPEDFTEDERAEIHRVKTFTDSSAGILSEGDTKRLAAAILAEMTRKEEFMVSFR